MQKCLENEDKLKLWYDDHNFLNPQYSYYPILISIFFIPLLVMFALDTERHGTVSIVTASTSNQYITNKIFYSPMAGTFISTTFTFERK